MKASFVRRVGTAVGVGALALTIGLFTSGTASAATTDGHHFGPEQFTVFESTFVPNGDVNAYGPVHGRNGALGSNSAGTVALFEFRDGTVFVAHPALPAPTINWAACTASVTQTGYWRFLGGTGRYWGARGFGTFQLSEFEVFGYWHHRCQAGNPYAQPRYFQVSVSGQGFAFRL
jgi:hypothetical protein